MKVSFAKQLQRLEQPVQKWMNGGQDAPTALWLFNECRWLLYNSTDPNGQLQWLATELHRAEASEEKVYIIGHVAPVKIECIPVWADNFRRIVNR
ncbi:hypothetical protein HPB52_024973 [Rhipicephalus sanguineus]|uniref:Uncharacterized protein n=1 Tax=Rhipicephalus sanguineus TaxID=34632 RepID=A0A9D4TDN5_RHISA|nr:hypothetical protein HPB52_024973 [Rhipicephalus sanguineus]